MKFKFKIQQYQTGMVRSTTDVFTGQPNRDSSKYRRDTDKLRNGNILISIRLKNNPPSLNN